MLIGIDGNEANVKNRVGSNIYSYQLLQQFHKLKANFIIYLKNEPLPDLPAARSWWRYRVLKPGRFWTQWRLPLDLYLHQPWPDIFFSPGHYGPRWCPMPLIISVLDLSYIFFPKMFKKRDLFQLRQWTNQSIKKAARILTISQFSKNAIIDYYGLESDKVVVTYLGMNQKTQSAGWRTKYGLDGDYILYVGTLQPRKNLSRLIEAFSQLQGQALKLVIVGKKGWLYDKIFAKVKELNLEKKVIFTGFVPDNELSTFYQNAKCFVLVSLYEGFGLPVLEAMHYGCPVIASNVSSLPEIVSDAGVLVDPEDVNAIAAGIKKAIKNRKELAIKGKKQAQKFSWEKCARQTLKVLEEVKKSG